MKSKSNGLYCKLIKRFMDFLIAALSIIIFSPLLIILAILVRVKLGGPVIFKQERPGLTGLAHVSGRNAITWTEKFSWQYEV